MHRWDEEYAREEEQAEVVVVVVKKFLFLLEHAWENGKVPTPVETLFRQHNTNQDLLTLRQ